MVEYSKRMMYQTRIEQGIEGRQIREQVGEVEVRNWKKRASGRKWRSLMHHDSPVLSGHPSMFLCPMPHAPCPMPGALCDRFSLSFSHLLYSIFPSLLFFPHFSLFLFLEFLRLTWDDHNISQTPPFLTSFLFLLFLPIYQCMSIASSSSFEVCLLSTDISSSSSFFFFSVKKKKMIWLECDSVTCPPHMNIVCKQGLV